MNRAARRGEAGGSPRRRRGARPERIAPGLLHSISRRDALSGFLPECVRVRSILSEISRPPRPGVRSMRSTFLAVLLSLAVPVAARAQVGTTPTTATTEAPDEQAVKAARLGTEGPA